MIGAAWVGLLQEVLFKRVRGPWLTLKQMNIQKKKIAIRAWTEKIYKKQTKKALPLINSNGKSGKDVSLIKLIVNGSLIQLKFTYVSIKPHSIHSSATFRNLVGYGYRD